MVCGSMTALKRRGIELRLARGKFITLEGIEGSGKSLQLHRLSKALECDGIPFRTTFEPGGTAFGQELRRILLSSESPDRNALPELLLYLADRVQHIKEVIEPSLESGFLVLSDRYHDATLAYQGYARGLGFEIIDRLAETLSILIPDLTLFFDIEPEIGLERARSRNVRENTEDLGRFEEEDVRFHRRVMEGYHALARRHPERIQMVDARGTPDEVFSRAWKLLSQNL